MKWVIISDELGALGWRLAGAQQLIADGHNVQGRLAEAQGEADVVFVTVELAQRLPESVFEEALLNEKPIIAVIAGLPSGSEPPDLEREVKRVLGIGV